MLLSLALFAALSTAGAAPTAAVIDFKVVKLKKDQGTLYTEHMARRLTERGVSVTSAKDIEVMLSAHRRKQLLGCVDRRKSCTVQLAAALKVEAVVVGSVAKSGASFQVKVRVLSATTAKPLFVYSKLVRKEADILEALDTAAQRAALKLGADGEAVAQAPPVEPTPPVATAPVAVTPSPTETTPPPTTTTAAAPTPPPEEVIEDVLAPTPTISRTRRSKRVKWQPWAVAGGGALVAGLGTALLVSSSGTWSTLTGTPTLVYPPSQAAEDATAAGGLRTAGLVVLGAGVAVAAAGIAWIFLEPKLRWLTFAPTTDGFAFSLMGRW